MLDKHVKFFNQVTEDIDNWINQKHKNSEVKCNQINCIHLIVNHIT